MINIFEVKQKKINPENHYIKMPDFTPKSKIEERDIILEMVQEVSKKFLVEFRSGTHRKIVHHGDWHEEIIEPDSRKEAIQGTELITSLLRHYFKNKRYDDLGMEKKHQELIKKRKKLVEDFEKTKKTNEDEDELIANRLLLARDWFGGLIMLLHQTNYLRRKRKM